MKDFVVGAQLYSVRTLTQDYEGLRNVLGSIKKMGYNTCQLSGQSRAIPDEAVADLLRENEIQCVVTHNSMDDFDNHLPELIERHKKWNCKYAGLGAMPDDCRTDGEKFCSFAKHINEIAKKLRDEGLVFVYHNHAFEFQRFNGTLGMDILFDTFNDAVQFELDSYWIQAGGGNPVEWFKKVDGRMDVAHYKDMVGLNTSNPHCKIVPLGEGNLNFYELKKVCEETSVRFVEIEQDNAVEADDPLGQMAISAKNAKKIGFTL